MLTNLAKGHALLEGRNFISKKDVPLVIKTALSTAQIERTSIFSLLLANKGSLTTSQITEYLNMSKPTALRTMAEIKAVGLVNEDWVGAEKCVTLRPEFEWFLSEEFAKLNEDFKPVDYSVFLREKDKDVEQRKEKSPPYTSDENEDASLTKLDDFWRIFNQLESEQALNPESTMSIDKNTVGGEQLRQRLLSSNLFSQSEAGMMIRRMVKEGYLEQVMLDTFRKKKQWSRESNGDEDNSKK